MLTNKTNKQEYEKVIEKIITNNNFKKSARSVHIVKFLYEKALEGTDVNEFILGDELFQKNYNYKNSDSKVRVYVHYLRKKLSEYYKNEGKLDPIRVEIKKGQYNISFKEIEIIDNDTVSPSLNNKTSYFVYLSLILLGTLLGISLNFNGIKKIFSKNYLWEGFFKNDSKNICVVGDIFMVQLPTNPEKEKIYAIHSDFITKQDYLNYLKKPNKSNEKKIGLVDFSVMTKMAPVGVKKLTQWFQKNNHDFSIRMEKSMEMDELRDNNIIFMGNFRLMAGLKDLFLSNSKKFELHNNNSRISSIDNNGKRKIYKTQYPEHVWDKDKSNNQNNIVFVEYAMVSFVKLENNNNILFFSSNHDIGVMATIDKFTTPQWLKAFYKKNNLNEDSEFNALFKVSGLNRSVVNSEMIDIEILH